MNWELVQTAPDEVVTHVIEEYEKMQTRLGIVERSLQLASEATREGVPSWELPDAPPLDAEPTEWEDYWVRRGVIELGGMVG